MKNQSLANPTRFKATKALSLFLALQMLFLNVLPVAAIPVVHGDSTGYSIEPDGPNAYVLQYNNDALPLFGADISYTSFNISQGNTLRIHDQAGVVSIHRDKSGNLSSIHGGLTANGIVYLINPNGILFGANAQVNVGGLVAAAMNMTERNVFEGASGDITFQSGAVINAASFAHFLGSRIIGRDLAAITAPKKLFGEVGISDALNRVVLGEAGGGSISLEVTSAGNAKFEAKGASLTITNLNLGGNGEFSTDGNLTLTNGTMNAFNSLTLNAGTNLQSWSAIHAGDVQMQSLEGILTIQNTVTAADDIILAAAESVYIRSNVTAQAGNLSVTGGGVYVYSGAALSAGSNVWVTSTNTGMTVQTIEAGNDVMLSSAMGLAIASNVTAHAGSISAVGQNNVYTASGAALFAGSNVVLSAANYSLAISNTIVAGNDVTLSALGYLNIHSNVTAQAGNLSVTGAIINLLGDATATLGDISIHATDGSFVASNNLTAGRDLIVTAKGDISAPGTINAGSNITMTGSSIGVSNSLTATTGNLTLAATNGALTATNLWAGSNITLSASGDVNLLGTTTSQYGNITVTGATVTASGAVNSQAGTIRMAATSGDLTTASLWAFLGIALTAEETVNVISAETANCVNWDFTVTGKTVNISADLNDSNGPIKLTATDGDLTINGNMGANHGVTLSASGDVLINGFVQGVGGLTVTGSSITALDYLDAIFGNVKLTATNGNITATNVTARTGVTLMASENVNISGIMDAGILNGVAVTGATIRFDKTVTATNGDISIHATDSDFVVGDNLTAGWDLIVTAKGDISVPGTVNAGSNITFTGATVGISNSLTAPGSITLAATNGALTIADLTAGNDVLLKSTAGITNGGRITAQGLAFDSGGAVTLSDLDAVGTLAGTAAGNVAVAGSNIVIGTVGTYTGLTSGASMGITGSTITATADISATGSLTLLATNGAVVMSNTLTGLAGDIRVTGDTLDLQNVVKLNSFPSYGVYLTATNGSLTVGGVQGGSPVELLASDAVNITGGINGGTIAITGATVNVTGTEATPTLIQSTSMGISIHATNGNIFVGENTTVFAIDTALLASGVISNAGTIGAASKLTLNAAEITSTTSSQVRTSSLEFESDGDVDLHGFDGTTTVAGTAGGDIQLEGGFGITIGTVGVYTGLTADASVSVTSADVTATTDVIAVSNITLTAATGSLTATNLAAATGDITLSAAQTITLNGAVQAVAGNVTITNGGNITMLGEEIRAGGDVLLKAGGNITGTNGVEASGTLRMLATNAPDGTIEWATPGAFRGTEGITLLASSNVVIDAGMSSVSGAVHVVGTAGAVELKQLASAGGDLVVTGATVTVAGLSASNVNVAATGGDLSFVSVTATDSMQLTATGDVGSSAMFAIVQAGNNVTITGATVTIPSLSFGEVSVGGVTTQTGDIHIHATNGNLAVPNLIAGGSVDMEASGAVGVANLVNVGSNITMTGASVGISNSLTAPGSIALTATNGTMATTNLTAGTDMVLSSTDSMVLNGALDAGNQISLTTGSNLTSAASSSITAAALDFDAGGDVELAGLDVGVVAGTATGSIALASATNLTVGTAGGHSGLTAGAATNANITVSAWQLSVTNDMSAGGAVTLAAWNGIENTGDITAGSIVLETTGAGAILSTNGALVASNALIFKSGGDVELAGLDVGVVAGTATGSIALASATNLVIGADGSHALSGLTAAGSNAAIVVEANRITVSNDVATLGGPGGTNFIGSGVTFAGGNLSAQGGNITLNGTGTDALDITVEAPTIFSNTTVLTAQRDVLVVAGASSTGKVTVTSGDLSLLANQGSLDAGGIYVGGDGLDVAGDLVMEGTQIVDAGGLISGGGATNYGVWVVSGVEAGGSISLTSATNIRVDAAITAGTNISLTGSSVGISNRLTAPGSITLAATNGDLNVNGAVTATNNVTLTASETVSIQSNVTARAGHLSVTGATIQVSGATKATLGDIVIHATNGHFAATTNLVAGRHLSLTASGDMEMTERVWAVENISVTGATVKATSLAGSNVSVTATSGDFLFSRIDAYSAVISAAGHVGTTNEPLVVVNATNNVTITGATISLPFVEITGPIGGVYSKFGDIRIHATNSNLTTPNVSALVGSVDIQASGALTVATNGIIIAGSNLTLTGSSVGISNRLTAPGSLALTATNGDMRVSGALAATNDMTLSASGAIAIHSNVTVRTGTLDIVAGGNITATNGGIDAATLGRIIGSNVALNITTAGRDVGFGLIAATNRLELTAAAIGGPSGATGFYDANGDALNLSAGGTALLNIGGYFGTLADPMEVSIAGHVEIDSAGLTARDTPKGYIFVVYNQDSPLPVSWKYIGNSQPGEIIINGDRQKEDDPVGPSPPPPAPEPTINPADYWRMMSALSFVQDTPVIRPQTADVGKAFFLHSDLPLSNEYVLGLVQYLQSTGSRITVSRSAREMDAYNRWGISNWLKDYTIPPAGLPYENTLDFLPEASAPVEQLASTSL